MRTAILASPAIALMLAVVPAQAQQKPAQSCPEGRTFAGDCVDPGIGIALRRNAIAQTQPRISYMSPPWLPMYDRGIYVAKNFHEMNNIFLPPLTTRNTSIKP